jgi:Xaa-Pro aminopeptidase
VRLTKRQFLALTGFAGIGALLPARAGRAQTTPTKITAGVTPITVDERKARVAKAQRLLRQHGMVALLLEAGSSLVYFTGVRWWRSERYTGAVIPRDGDIAFVTPYFEEPSVRESMSFGDEIRTWHEHENPFGLVAGILADRGLTDGRIGVEGTVRHFIVDGVQKAAPRFEMVSGDAVVRGCRMYKSEAEIALMQAANDVTMAAYRHLHAQVEPGMSPEAISALMNEATTNLGGEPRFAMALLNDASAYPHGTRQPQVVREGGVVLMDCGCSVHDYESDISRTWVVGEPTRKQRDVWNAVKRGQQLALETAVLGTPAGRIDDAVRTLYKRQGYGPGYRLPGLSHRVGHGIGMDGHEPVNFVHGESTPLAPGMCFSNEPGIYIRGEFGVRLEDCLHMTTDGPQLFTELSPSLDRPFG